MWRFLLALICSPIRLLPFPRMTKKNRGGAWGSVDDVIMTQIVTRRIADIFVKRSTKRPRDESIELPDCVTHHPQFLPREVAATVFDRAEPLTASWPGYFCSQ